MALFYREWLNFDIDLIIKDNNGFQCKRKTVFQ